MSRAGSVAWFARHEFRLAWRDFVAMVTAGRRRRAIAAAIGFVAFAAFMHGLAWYMVGQFAGAGADPAATGKDVLLYVTVIGLLSWSLLVSQALEAVTRAFYARADLDLILSSPAPAARIFAVRIGAIALAMMVMAILIAGAFIDVLAVAGGARWLLAYGAVAAGGAAATAIAVGLTVFLFHVIGPRRTRFVAQVLAAVIGAMFVIGLQGAAILSYGTISRFAILQSEKLARLLPPAGSAFWFPARAVMGEPAALAAVAAVSLLMLTVAVALFATRFSEHAIAAAGAPQARPGGVVRRARFRRLTAAGALRRKEWMLLRRDPWLISQTLMQLLYLLPPALLLWLKVGEDADAVIVIVPVLVVAAGQLAGGLAWLAVSGEDAPDLIAAAPVPPRMVVRAKVEAVLGSIAIVSAPLLAMLALAAPLAALATAVVIAAAALEATAIQLLFRAQARRSHFRRRQTSSRVATFAEAFSSMAWAATAGLAVAGTWLALMTAMTAVSVLGVARLLRPPGGEAGRRPVAAPRAV
jgi:ABC-2 type transport system permease protein